MEFLRQLGIFVVLCVFGVMSLSEYRPKRTVIIDDVKYDVMRPKRATIVERRDLRPKRATVDDLRPKRGVEIGHDKSRQERFLSLLGNSLRRKRSSKIGHKDMRQNHQFVDHFGTDKATRSEPSSLMTKRTMDIGHNDLRPKDAISTALIDLIRRELTHMENPGMTVKDDNENKVVREVIKLLHSGTSENSRKRSCLDWWCFGDKATETTPTRIPTTTSTTPPTTSTTASARATSAPSNSNYQALLEFLSKLGIKWFG